ncbi:MAG: hypothetical protein JWQ38_3232 [Flavipsychrobacter sp.]|nr:hypothetical protein [Flavipsychrobacter sp.]
MKKVALLAFGMSLIISSANAQFYFNTGLGYAIPTAGQTLDGNGTPYSGTYSRSTFRENYAMKAASYSSGLSCTVGFGYMFTDHVGVQTDAYLGIYNTKNSFVYENANLGGAMGNVTINSRSKSTIFLTPALVLQTGGSSAWNLYTRTGVVLPLISTVTVDEIYNVPSQGLTTDLTSKIKTSFSPGLSASAGVQYRLGDRTMLWGELGFTSMSLFTKESQYTRVTQNGVSYPVDSIGGPNLVKYSKTVVVDSNGTTAPAWSLPFSNFGINVGIRIMLSDKKRKGSEAMEDNKSKPYKRKR